MRTPPGIDFDWAHGRIVIAGQGFPAAIVGFNSPTCFKTDPCSSCVPFGHCILGGALHLTDHAWDDGWGIYVPMENGVMGDVEYSIEDRSLSLHLCAPVVKPARSDPDEGGRVLETMMVVGRTIVPYEPLGGHWYWSHVEAEWLAEHLHRISRFPVQRPEGPRCKLYSIKDVRVRPRGEVLA